MISNLKHGARCALLLTLLAGIPMMTRAQTSSPGSPKPGSPATPAKKVQVDDKETAKGVPPEKYAREAPEEASAADRETESYRRTLDRDLLNLRRQFESEALNRMRYGQSSLLDRMMRAIVPFSVFLVITFVLVWILRVVLDNRRWYRMVKVQTDMHTKLLDRFASSQDVIAYMESDAGKRFLESPRFDIQPKQSAAFPYGRILWSAQVGLIVATAGAGLIFLRGRVPAEGDAPLLVFGTLAVTLGFGFLLSAAASYALSKQFGLLEHPAHDAAVSGPESRRS